MNQPRTQPEAEPFFLCFSFNRRVRATRDKAVYLITYMRSGAASRVLGFAAGLSRLSESLFSVSANPPGGGAGATLHRQRHRRATVPSGSAPPRESVLNIYPVGREEHGSPRAGVSRYSCPM